VPKVSVIVPNYNHAPYLEWRIDSILKQTFRDFDVLLLDDASTDNSREVIERYRGRPQVRICYNDTNSGSVFCQWEKGISLTSGDYIWIAESDDWADPHFLERLVPLLDTHPRVGLAYCQSWIADRDFKIIGNAICWTEDLDPERWKSNFIATGTEEIRDYFLTKVTIPNASAVLQRRAIVERVRPIATDFRLCGDWMHWMRILAISNVAFVAENLNFWRFHSSNARKAPPGILEWKEGERIITHGCATLGLSQPETERHLFSFLKRCWTWLSAYSTTLPAPISPT
jgi:glycosyltransferase involved in cell wall biosynthesis